GGVRLVLVLVVGVGLRRAAGRRAAVRIRRGACRTGRTGRTGRARAGRARRLVVVLVVVLVVGLVVRVLVVLVEVVARGRLPARGEGQGERQDSRGHGSLRCCRV